MVPYEVRIMKGVFREDFIVWFVEDEFNARYQ